ncbi:hypothetical protein Sjap_003820 [Stephania japonica]|uniref:Secreted protein n=1 Tax=Stephania japonica TaxID=461633 RepID=A0AAP0PVD9_9MAGN
MPLMMLVLLLPHHHHARLHPIHPPTIKTAPTIPRIYIPAITATTATTATAAALTGPPSGGGPLPLHLPKLLQVHLQRLHVVLESQSRHRPEKIVTVDRLPLLSLTLIRRLSRDEAYELRHALLHRLLRVFRDLRVRWQRFLHDPTHVRYWQKPVLLSRRELAVGIVVVPPRLVVRVRHYRLTNPTFKRNRLNLGVFDVREIGKSKREIR